MKHRVGSRILDAARFIWRGLFSLYLRLAGSQPSETSKCRSRLASFCSGYGVDIGFGGDPIVEHAIRVDLPEPYSRHRLDLRPVQLGGDARNLGWFRDETLDFVYSSHLLEDFDDPEPVLREWLRVLRPGGKLVLYCPDEQVFRRYCAATGHPGNPYHKNPEFSLAFVKAILGRIGNVQVIHEKSLVDVYSWELVCAKKGG